MLADDRQRDTRGSRGAIRRLARQYRFFHWHVEFPHMFRTGNGAHDVDPATGWSGGFSCVIGNPPWERVKLQEQEFFAAKGRPDIAGAANAAARKKMIAALADGDSPADRALTRSSRVSCGSPRAGATCSANPAAIPLTGRGDVNTYAVFAETGRTDHRAHWSLWLDIAHRHRHGCNYGTVLPRFDRTAVARFST